MPHDGRAVAVSNLTTAEAGHRRAILGQLKEALSARDVAAELVGRRKLVLRSEQAGGEHWPQAMPADPQLYVFAAGGVGIVTTDGQDYRLPDGRTHPVADPGGAARLVATAFPGARG